MGDVKAYLRKMDFPSVVPEALRHIQKLWMPDCTSQQIDLMKELSEEFVFFEVDKWGNKRTVPHLPIKELQIVERLASYFKTPDNEKKMATFHFLFPKGSKMLTNRLPVLQKLLSLAIATENGNALSYIGAWMQLCSCTSDYSITIAKSVMREHIKPHSINDRIKSLPIISPLFCSSLIIALADLYLESCPPEPIFKLILEWITVVPSLCFASYKLIIPKPFNFSGPQNPIPSLMYLCILSPLHQEIKKIYEVDAQTFSAFVFAVLQCMIKSTTLRDQPWGEPVTAQHMSIIANTLNKMDTVSKEQLDAALDRFAMCLEISLSTNCLHSRLPALFNQCLQLPYNRPMKIVVQKWSHVLTSFKK